jgi:hypothetical protein
VARCAGLEVHAGVSVAADFSRACRADYLFWWARRLLAWARHGFDPWYAFMAILAARQALAHLVGFAGTLVHEFGHKTLATLTNNHCKPLVPTPLSLYNKPVGCCFLWSDAAFYSRMLATYGLPWPENPDGPYTEDAFEIPFGAYEGHDADVPGLVQRDTTHGVWAKTFGALARERGHRDGEEQHRAPPERSYHHALMTPTPLA